MNLFSNIKQQVIHLLSCCNKGDDESSPSRAIEIGNPKDFRRVDIDISGLTAEQQAFIREKAIIDASRIFSGDLPSPISDATFPHSSLTQPMPQTSEMNPLVHQQLSPSTLDRMRKHTRRLSQRFGFNETYEAVNKEEVGMETLESADVSRRESFDSKGFEGGNTWAGRDSVTLGGSERGEQGESAI